MTDPRLQRKSLRAPLKSTALYVDGEHVFKARILNLSEGGVLLSELPHIPDSDTLAIAINLILYPRFQGMGIDELKQFSIDDFSRIILKTKVKMMRTFENQNKVDLVFINFIGCLFENPEQSFLATVLSYVETFAKNTVYLLSLFETLGARPEQLELLRTVAHLLGYDRRMKLPLLRSKVLHDYQSLGSL